MKKNYYLQVLVALMVCLACALGASAYDFTFGGIYYSITTYSDGSSVATVENNGSTNTYSGIVTIPATVEYNGKTYDRLDCYQWGLQKKAEGKIRHFGFSFHGSPEYLEKTLDTHPEIEFVQI